MIDTPPTLPTPAAEPAEAAAPAAEPRFRLIRAGLGDMFATLLAYAAPATAYIDEAIRAHHERTGADSNDSVRDTPHFDTIEAWCREHPSDAARIVLTAVYLASGRCAVQDYAPPPPPAPNPTLDAAAAVAAEQATQPPAEQPDQSGTD